MAEKQQVAQKERSEQAVPERTRGGMYFTPRVDIVETEKELMLIADVPGVRSDDVELRYERGELMLHGRVRPRQRPGQMIFSEYEEGNYYRVFNIHESIDSSRIEASCKNGVLTVHLPKAAAAQPKQINVKAE
jgi:HSP20 family protein